MTDPASGQVSPPAKKGEAPLIRFSRPARWIVAGGCLVMAAGRILLQWPIDALSAGLIGAGVLILFARIKKVGWGGVEASFEEQVAQATQKLEAAEEPPTAIKPPPPPKPLEPIVIEPGPAEVVVEGHAPAVVISPAKPAPRSSLPPTNPTERVLWAVEQIRRELIILAGNSGNLPQRQLEWDQYRSEPLARNLLRRGMIAEEVLRAVTVVSEARNELVHAGLSAEELTRTDTLTLELLQKLRDVKRQYTRVREPNPAVFVDDHLTVPYEQVKGVMLVTIDEQGQTLNISVYPRGVEYERGRLVSWEWDLKRGSDDEVFYTHPVTGNPTVAWSESAMFVGRQYPKEWELEYRLPNPNAGLE